MAGGITGGESFPSSNDLVMETGGSLRFDDNVKLFFGTASDASILYDETNLVIDPQEVGSGSLVLFRGDLTISSGTLNPRGDTAAGDAAALGYTVSEGIIITGQGSNNDVTIKNDADANVAVVPTGTQIVEFVTGQIKRGSQTVNANNDNGAGSTINLHATSVGVNSVVNDGS